MIELEIKKQYDLLETCEIVQVNTDDLHEAIEKVLQAKNHTMEDLVLLNEEIHYRHQKVGGRIIKFNKDDLHKRRIL